MDPSTITKDMETIKSRLEEWRASMDEKDRIIHELAVKMMPTSYDPRRCTSFVKWQEKRQKEKTKE